MLQAPGLYYYFHSSSQWLSKGTFKKKLLHNTHTYKYESKNTKLKTKLQLNDETHGFNESALSWRMNLSLTILYSS